ERIVALEVRRLGGPAQRIEAALRRTRGRGGEFGQLEDHPRAGIELGHVEVQGRPFGGHLDLGARANVAAGDGVVLAVAAQHHRRLSGRSTATERAGTAGRSGRGSGGTARGAEAGRARTGTAGSSGTRARTAAEPAGGVESKAPDIALA